MLSRALKSLLLILPFIAANAVAQQNAELSTLFTTPNERQVINENRYKQDGNRPLKVQIDAPAPVEAEKIVKQVNLQYQISGISINRDGSRVAWVNSQAYGHGERMPDGSLLKINNGAVTTVSITTPDGKRHTGTSGETLDVTILQAVEE